MSNIQFQGIVAVGNTRAQAINRYRMMAMGKGATCFVDKNNTKAFVSNAASDLENIFNPENGNMDLVQSEEALNSLSFEARAGDVHEAFHYQCTAGCGSHLLFDSDAFVQHCPVCASAIASSDDGEEDADEDDLSDEELDDLDVDDELEDEDMADDEPADDSDESADSEDSEATAADADDDADSDSDDTDEDEGDEDASDDTDEDEDDTDDEEDDSDSEEGDDASDSEQDEEDDMADAPLVVAANSRDEALQEFSKLQSKKLVATASAVQTVNYMVCASDEGCGAHIVSVAELSDCPRPECGKPLAEPVAEAADESDSDEDSNDDLDLDADDADASSDADDGEGSTGDDTSMSVIDDEDSSDEEKDKSKDESESATASDEDSSDDDSSDEDEDEDDAGDDEEMDEVEVDLMDDVPEDASVEDLDVSYSAAVAGSPAWTAYFKGRPVAVATHASIQKDHKDIFDTARFGHAAVAASKIGGVQKVLRELGFTGIKARLSVPKRIETRAVALASEQREQMDLERSEYAQRLEAALATAGIGITRGFFQGQTNPVRDSLNAALASCGVRNPEVIVDNALRASFEVFLQSMFDRARDILAKPAEVQESLSKTVLDVAYMPNGVVTASSTGNLESRLSNLGTVVASDENRGSKPETAVAAAASDDFSARLTSVIGGLGRR